MADRPTLEQRAAMDQDQAVYAADGLRTDPPKTASGPQTWAEAVADAAR